MRTYILHTNLNEERRSRWRFNVVEAYLKSDKDSLHRQTCKFRATKSTKPIFNSIERPVRT